MLAVDAIVIPILFALVVACTLAVYAVYASVEIWMVSYEEKGLSKMRDVNLYFSFSACVGKVASEEKIKRYTETCARDVVVKVKNLESGEEKEYSSVANPHMYKTVGEIEFVYPLRVDEKNVKPVLVRIEKLDVTPVGGGIAP
jgi:uncharacterized protein YlaN (UPF0358 family)